MCTDDLGRHFLESKEQATGHILNYNFLTGSRSYRCASGCRSRGREFDPGLVPYFRGDRS